MLSGLLTVAWSAYFLIENRTTSPVMEPPTMGLAFTHAWLIKKMSYCWIILRNFLNWGFILTDNCKLYINCHNTSQDTTKEELMLLFCHREEITMLRFFLHFFPLPFLLSWMIISWLWEYLLLLLLILFTHFLLSKCIMLLSHKSRLVFYLKWSPSNVLSSSHAITAHVSVLWQLAFACGIHLPRLSRKHKKQKWIVDLDHFLEGGSISVYSFSSGEWPVLRRGRKE